jgi:hypothetical protein
MLLSEPPPPLPLTSPLPERATGKACAVPKDGGSGDLSSATRLADGWHTHVRDLELQSPIWLRQRCWSDGPRQWRHPWNSAEGIGPGVSRQDVHAKGGCGEEVRWEFRVAMEGAWPLDASVGSCLRPCTGGIPSPSPPSPAWCSLA